MIYLILFFVMFFIIVTAIGKIKDTKEKRGSERAFLSCIYFVCLLVVLVLMLSGVGAIGAIPIVLCARMLGKLL